MAGRDWSWAPLAEIVDLDRLVATVHVPRAEAPALKMGQKAKINGAEAAVAFISP